MDHLFRPPVFYDVATAATKQVGWFLLFGEFVVILWMLVLIFRDQKKGSLWQRLKDTRLAITGGGGYSQTIVFCVWSIAACLANVAMDSGGDLEAEIGLMAISLFAALLVAWAEVDRRTELKLGLTLQYIAVSAMGIVNGDGQSFLLIEGAKLIPSTLMAEVVAIGGLVAYNRLSNMSRRHRADRSVEVSTIPQEVKDFLGTMEYHRLNEFADAIRQAFVKMMSKTILKPVEVKGRKEKISLLDQSIEALRDLGVEGDMDVTLEELRRSIELSIISPQQAQGARHTTPRRRRRRVGGLL